MTQSTGRKAMTTRTGSQMNTDPARKGTHRRTAAVVGALFLIATSMYILGDGMVAGITGQADFLAQISSNRGTVVAGVLMTFVTAVANTLIGILLFPILKVHNERIALGYAFTRFFDGVGVLFAGISTLSLVSLGQQFLKAGAPVDSHFQSSANLLVAQSALSFDITMIVLGLGAIPFCYLLFRARLIPRWMAAVGFIGYVSLFGGGLIELFGFDLAMIHYLPGGVFELVLPIWLIFRGFNSTLTNPGETGAVSTRRGEALAGAR